MMRKQATKIEIYTKRVGGSKRSAQWWRLEDTEEGTSVDRSLARPDLLH